MKRKKAPYPKLNELERLIVEKIENYDFDDIEEEWKEESLEFEDEDKSITITVIVYVEETIDPETKHTPRTVYREYSYEIIDVEILDNITEEYVEGAVDLIAIQRALDY